MEVLKLGLIVQLKQKFVMLVGKANLMLDRSNWHVDVGDSIF